MTEIDRREAAVGAFTVIVYSRCSAFLRSSAAIFSNRLVTNFFGGEGGSHHGLSVGSHEA